MALTMRIMHEFDDEEVPTSIVYDEEEMRLRLQQRLNEELGTDMGIFSIPKVKHTRKEIHEALDRSFDGFFKEFKRKTIRLK